MPETDLDPAQSFEQPPLGDAGVREALAAGEPAMRCDEPDLFGTREATVPVEIVGWATSPAGIEGVTVTIDNRIRREAAHGLVRIGLGDLLGERTMDAGFSLGLDPTECPPGWHHLTIVARTGDGRRLGISGDVYCVPPDEAKAEHGPTWEPLPGGVRAPTPERYARYRWAADLVAGGTVLDAGCGSGLGTALLAEHARETVGIDASPPAVEEARRDHGGGARFELADMRELPFADGEFDSVVCFEAIAQVAEPEAVLDELRRVLAPGGLLLVATPNRDAYPQGNPLHLSELSSEQLGTALGERFANVAVFRQHSYHASILCGEATLAHADPRVSVGAEVKKLAGGPPGSELYAVAAATDGELPAEPAWVVLGEGVDQGEQQRRLEQWQRRAVEAEVMVAESHRYLHAMRRMEQSAVHEGSQHL